MPLERISIQPAGGGAQPKVCISSLEKVGRVLLGLQTSRTLTGLYSLLLRWKFPGSCIPSQTLWGLSKVVPEATMEDSLGLWPDLVLLYQGTLRVSFSLVQLALWLFWGN